MVYDENNNPITNVEISVAGVNHDVTSGKFGLSWLKPCSYLYSTNWISYKMNEVCGIVLLFSKAIRYKIAKQSLFVWFFNSVF